MNGDTAAAIFWAKTQMGWKEKSEIEHSGNVNFNTYMEPKPDGH
jgi:hypothetical protein